MCLPWEPKYLILSGSCESTIFQEWVSRTRTRPRSWSWSFLLSPQTGQVLDVWPGKSLDNRGGIITSLEQVWYYHVFVSFKNVFIRNLFWVVTGLEKADLRFSHPGTSQQTGSGPLQSLSGLQCCRTFLEKEGSEN